MTEIKMHDLAEKNMVCECPTPKNKDKKYYPSLSLDDADYLSEFNINDEIELVINGKVKSIRSDGKKLSYSIEMQECGVKNIADKKQDGGSPFDDVHHKTEKRVANTPKEKE